MVTNMKKAASIKPSDFYGSGLPRPRFFDNPKFNPDRVDPPAHVLDPLLSWAADAHWSMGGLSSKRLRLQGRIEGSVTKLRTQLENSESSPSVKVRVESNSPPPAPAVTKRRKMLDLDDESDDEETTVVAATKSLRGIVRNLGCDFDKAAIEFGVGNSRKRTRASGGFDEVMKVVEEVKKLDSKRKNNEQIEIRTSARLSKRRLA